MPTDTEIVVELVEGQLVVQVAPVNAYISVELLTIGSPFVTICDGLIVLSVSNGRWWYRPVGREHNAIAIRLVDSEFA